MKLSNNESIWNERVFDDVTGIARQKLTAAFINGSLADFEPLYSIEYFDIDSLPENEVIEHAHMTRDNFLKSLKRKI